MAIRLFSIKLSVLGAGSLIFDRLVGAVDDGVMRQGELVQPAAVARGQKACAAADDDVVGDADVARMPHAAAFVAPQVALGDARTAPSVETHELLITGVVAEVGIDDNVYGRLDSDLAVAVVVAGVVLHHDLAAADGHENAVVEVLVDLVLADGSIFDLLHQQGHVEPTGAIGQKAAGAIVDDALLDQQAIPLTRLHPPRQAALNRAAAHSDVAGAVDDQAAATGIAHDQPVERDVLALLDGDQGRLGGDGQIGPVDDRLFALVGGDENGGVDGARLLDV